MWIFRWLIILIVVFFLVGFLSQNSEPKVHVELIGWKSPELPLSFMLFLAALVGYAASLVVAIINQIRLRSEIASQKRRNQALQNELERLRNFALEEESSGSEVSPS
ncbi:MAG: LapA family protein [Calditrichaeota bacterium]|nr:LapA family protein [Calditrichota bacterium]MCB9391541.1 LapA family protein [Calditrichota bacterium]